MAAADSGSRRRFAVACGVLSRCVKAEVAGKMAAARPAAATAASTMLLMPGADVGEEAEATPTGGNGQVQAQAQLTIMYGGRVLVFDDFPVDRAAELVRVAGSAGQDVAGGGFADLPVARKASLQRFMEKRRERLGARAPYAGRPSSPAAAAKKRKEEKVAEAECWLGLGTPGGCAAR